MSGSQPGLLCCRGILLDGTADCRGDMFKSLTLGTGFLAGRHAAFPGLSDMRKPRAPDVPEAAGETEGPPCGCCLAGEVVPSRAPPQPAGDCGGAGASKGLGAAAFGKGLVARAEVETPTPGGAFAEHALLEVGAFELWVLAKLVACAEDLASPAGLLDAFGGDTAAEGDGEPVWGSASFTDAAASR